MPYKPRFYPRRQLIQTLVEAKYPSVNAAARAMNLAPGTLHDILSGRRHGREDTLRRIADYLEVVFLHIVDRVEDEDDGVAA